MSAGGGSGRPPRLALLLLRLGVRGPAAEFVIGDLVEEYEERAGRGGAAGARLWFWRQTLATVSAMLVRRDVRRRGRSASLRPRAVRRGSVVSWLDMKLGLRMLAKYPGLSLVSVLGMSVAVAIGAGAFGSIHSWLNSELPLPGGDRIVALENHDARAYGRPDRRILHDFHLWREALESVSELAAFRDEPRNLIAADGRTELVRVAAMSASGFRIARVSPVLGRPLLPEDERPGASPVVVVSYDEWQRRFEGDPDILDRTLRLGSTVHEVVGVMPRGFRFPVNHGFWTPLRLDPSDYDRGAGPALRVFGRLAEGASLEQAQAELTTLGVATAADHPDSHGHLRPRVMPYPRSFVDVDDPQQEWAFRVIPLAVGLLLVLVAVNVGILVYARTANRLGEIAVRSALGASRRRVVAQLFVEALVLAVLAAALGLAVASGGLARAGDWMQRVSPGRIPYWWQFSLSGSLVAYVAGLAIVAGVIIGVVPGLKATGRRVQPSLQQASGRGSGMRLGRLWTGLIVGQVAVAVVVLPFALFVTRAAIERGSVQRGYPAEEVLRARVEIPSQAAAEAEADSEASPGSATTDRARELLHRVEAEPAVAAATFATHFPGGGTYRRVEVEGAGTLQVQAAGIRPDLFRVIDVPVLAGRAFQDADTREGSTAIIVDRVFVDRVFGEAQHQADVLGRRVRYLTPAPDGGAGEVEAGPWLDIVGVVPDFVGPLAFDGAMPTLFRAMELGEAARPFLVVRTRGPAAGFADRLRDMAAAVDPELQLQEMRTAAEYQGFGQQALRLVALTLLAATLSVLLLSAAGIYAMLSFTVARRRREIGIRSALGAAPRRLLGGIFARASTQLGTGVVAGLLVAVVLDRLAGGGSLAGRGLLMLPAVAAVMMAVGLLAALGPARRGLAVQPTEALREE